MVADRPALLLAQDLGYAVGEDGAMTPTVVLHVDEHPEVAATPDGRFVIVWQQDERIMATFLSLDSATAVKPAP